MKISELFKKYVIKIYKEHLNNISKEIDNEVFSNLLSDLNNYVNDEDYIKFSNGEFPQTIDDVVDIEIDLLDKSNIETVKNLSKYEFICGTHFSHGMYIRNKYVHNYKNNIILLDNFKDTYTIFMNAESI